MSPDVLAAIFSGIGALLSAYLSVRFSRKRFERECAERIEQIRASFREGFEMGRS